MTAYYVTQCYCLYNMDLEELVLLGLCLFVLIETRWLVFVWVAVVAGVVYVHKQSDNIVIGSVFI